MRISDWSSDLCSSDLKPRADSVVAIEPASVAVLQRRFVMAFVDRNPGVALRIIGVLCEKLRRTNARITDGTGCATSARLARALMRLISEHGVRHGDGVSLGFRISQEELGNYFGQNGGEQGEERGCR